MFLQYLLLLLFLADCLIKTEAVNYVRPSEKLAETRQSASPLVQIRPGCLCQPLFFRTDVRGCSQQAIRHLQIPAHAQLLPAHCCADSIQRSVDVVDDVCAA